MENGIPNYLKEYVLIENYPKTVNSNFIVDGILKCSCGAEDFIIYREKENKTNEMQIAIKKISELIKHHKQECDDNEHLSIVNRDNRYYIAKENFKNNKEYLLEDVTELNNKLSNVQPVPIFLEAVCAHCGKKISVFNSSINGYDGLLNSSNVNYRKDFSTIKTQKCRKCGAESSKIKIHISSTGKKDLLSEQDSRLNDLNWEDAFDWITIDLKCSGCGHVRRKYLDIETM